MRSDDVVRRSFRRVCPYTIRVVSGSSTVVSNFLFARSRLFVDATSILDHRERITSPETHGNRRYYSYSIHYEASVRAKFDAWKEGYRAPPRREKKNKTFFTLNKIYYFPLRTEDHTSVGSASHKRRTQVGHLRLAKKCYLFVFLLFVPIIGTVQPSFNNEIAMIGRKRTSYRLLKTRKGGN